MKARSRGMAASYVINWLALALLTPLPMCFTMAASGWNCTPIAQRLSVRSTPSTMSMPETLVVAVTLSGVPFVLSTA